MEDSKALGHTEHTVTYQHNGRMGVYVCPNTLDAGVEILGLSAVTSPLTLMQQVRIEMSDDGGSFAEPPKRLRPYELKKEDFVQLIMWFEFDGCEDYSPGSGIEISSAEVEYRYRGRNRAMTMPLSTRVTVLLAEDHKCPAGRPHDGADTRYSERIANEVEIDASPYNDKRHERVQELTRAGTNLCRFFEGVDTPDALEDRAVFQLYETTAIAVSEIALETHCPEFADRRDQVVTALRSN
ncbi:MAG: hypothetical protein V3V01_20380 [Acidimicrobiales bacterium]